VDLRLDAARPQRGRQALGVDLDRLAAPIVDRGGRVAQGDDRQRRRVPRRR